MRCMDPVTVAQITSAVVLLASDAGTRPVKARRARSSNEELPRDCERQRENPTPTRHVFVTHAPPRGSPYVVMLVAITLGHEVLPSPNYRTQACSRPSLSGLDELSLR